MVPISHWIRRHLVPLTLIAIHIVLLAYSDAVHSPTENEAQHLNAGLHHLSTGSFSLYRVNPPLVKTLAALPVALTGFASDWSGYYEGPGARPEFVMGEAFVTKNGRQTFRMMTIARLACIPFSVIGAWVCFLWAKDLYGTWSGYLACCLWVFSPMINGNSSLITPDAHATALGLAACYTFWRWLLLPTWRQAIITGGVLGLAELTKTTLVLFYPLWPVIWLIYRLPHRATMTTQQWIREAGMLLLRMAIGLYLLNLGYLFEGSFSKLSDYQFVSRMLSGNTEGPGNRFRDSLLGTVPVPFPRDYMIGIDLQQRDFESFNRPSYLRGQYQSKGWWYYYAYAALVKAPLGTLGLLALTVAMQFSQSRVRIYPGDTLVLLLPAVVIFSVVSMKSGFSHHSRYMLPSVPFVFIWVSQLASTIPHAFVLLSKNGSPVRNRVFRAIPALATAFLLCWSVISSMAIYPHSLSYFNELAGGPLNGPQHLLISNIDWGQDLLFLEKWIRRNGKQTPVYLAFYNYYNPFDLAIEGIAPWPFDAQVASQAHAVPDGFYAISVNLLYEYPWPLRGHGKQRYRIDTRPLGHLRSIDPLARVGYSIRIFSADQVRAAYKAPELKLLPDH